MIPELVIVALDFYREPLRFSYLTNPQRSLPAGITDVLTAPMNVFSDENIEETAAMINATVDECREVVPFFIKQVLLDANGDYYRMLGVPRNADVSQIKQHFQYLIRLFHPDRDVNDDNWDELYASRINKAYNTLRNKDKRQEYDASLSAESWDGLELEQVEVSPRRVRVATESDRRATISPQARNFAIGLIAVFVIVMAMLVVKQTNQPSLRVQAGESHEPATTETSDSDALSDSDVLTVIKDHEKPADVKVENTPASTETIESVDVVVVEEKVSTEELIRRQVEQATIAVLGRPETKPVTKKAIRPVDSIAVAKEPMKGSEKKRKPQVIQASNVETEVHSASRKKHVQTAQLLVIDDMDNEKRDISEASELLKMHEPAIVSQGKVAETNEQIIKPVQTSEPDTNQTELKIADQTAQVAQIVTAASQVAAKSTKTISDAELFQLLAIFISSYETGNLDQFVGMFSDNAYTTDATGYRAIHKLYKDFFARPERRRIAISEFTWQDDADGGKVGSGVMSLSAEPLDGGKVWNGDGSLKLEVVRAGDGLKITSMYYEIHNK